MAKKSKASTKGFAAARPANGGARVGAGRPPGRQNANTIAFKEALKEGMKVLLEQRPDLPQDPAMALGWALLVKGLGNHPECLVRLAEWIGGKPKETIEFDPPVGGGGGGFLYQCFTADGRAIAAAPVPLPGKVPSKD